MASKEKKTNPYVTPGIGSSFYNWLDLFLKNQPLNTPMHYWLRAFCVGTITFILTPFRWYERFRLDSKIEKTTLKAPPVFIVGHWRSGTTHIHNLLNQDPQFGCVTNLQCMFPNSFMSNGIIPPLMEWIMPPSRPMDNMKLHLDGPQEEELALMNLTTNSFYNGWAYPHNMLDFYHKYIRFQNIKKADMDAWKGIYLKMLKKATLFSKGKRLVLKNPANTGRVKRLLELFPDAKFIHIYRNPYKVFVSTEHLYKTAMPQFCYQDIPTDVKEKNILYIYKDMMQAYFEESQEIPKENLVNLCFEDLEKGAMGELERIYTQLNLGNFGERKAIFETYLASLKSYKKNAYQYPKKVIEKVDEHWGFAIEKLGYKKEHSIVE